MAIELSKELKAEALASLERYFSENFEERIGNIAAGALLNFFLEKSALSSTTRPSRMFRNGWLRGFKSLTLRSTKTSSSTGAGKESTEPRRGGESAA